VLALINTRQIDKIILRAVAVHNLSDSVGQSYKIITINNIVAKVVGIFVM
jgi:hypothetical protein